MCVVIKVSSVTTDDHALWYVLRHNEGVWCLLKRPIENWEFNLIRNLISGQKCNILHQLFYHSISVTNGITKTMKKLVKRRVHSMTMHLFKSQHYSLPQPLGRRELDVLKWANCPPPPVWWGWPKLEQSLFPNHRPDKGSSQWLHHLFRGELDIHSGGGINCWGNFPG